MAATDPKKVELALQLLAINSGNHELTVRQLKEQAGITVNVKSLRNWSGTRYRARYRELFEEQADKVRAAAAVTAREIAADSAGLTSELLERTRERMQDLEPRDLAPSARAVSQVHASMTEKAQLLEGQPTARVDHGELPELLAELRAMNVLAPADKPRKIADAEVVEDEKVLTP